MLEWGEDKDQPIQVHKNENESQNDEKDVRENVAISPYQGTTSSENDESPVQGKNRHKLVWMQDYLSGERQSK